VVFKRGEPGLKRGEFETMLGAQLGNLIAALLPLTSELAADVVRKFD
jgi:hypothetical protein